MCTLCHFNKLSASSLVTGDDSNELRRLESYHLDAARVLALGRTIAWSDVRVTTHESDSTKKWRSCQEEMSGGQEEEKRFIQSKGGAKR